MDMHPLWNTKPYHERKRPGTGGHFLTNGIASTKPHAARRALESNMKSLMIGLAAVVFFASAARGQEIMPTPTPTPTPTPPPSEKVPIPASAVVASTHDGNVPANTVDGNLATRWTGIGVGSWIRFDLGTLRTVTHVRIAVYKGNERHNLFDLQVSRDGATWSGSIWTGQSSGATTQLETYDFPDVTGIRYVRYYGRGHVTNTGISDPRNSVTEVQVWAAPLDATTPPAAPLDVRGKAGANQATITWSSASSVTQYTVWRRASGCEPFTPLATQPVQPGNPQSYVDQTATARHRYYYVVTASNAAGTSPRSAMVTVTPIDPVIVPQLLPTPTPTTAPYTDVPVPAMNVQATPAHERVRVSWQSGSDNGWTDTRRADQFLVFRANAVCGPWVQVGIVGGGSREYVDATVQDGQTYFYLVAGRNPLGDSLDSSAPAVTPVAKAPSPPQNVQAFFNADGPRPVIFVSWDANFDADSYVVSRATVSDGPYTVLAASHPKTAPRTVYGDEALTPGQTYYYVIAARNGIGVSPYSSEVHITAAPAGAPTEAPGNFYLLSWRVGDSSCGGPQWTGVPNATEYHVYRKKETDAGDFVRVATVTTPWAVDCPIAPNDLYFYYVRAANSYGEGPATSTQGVRGYPLPLAKVALTSAQVAASTQDSNVPANTVDGSLATRWSGNGNGAWIRYDLGQVRPIGAVRIGVYGGNARRNQFDLILFDGTNTTTLARQSSGTTTLEEQYNLPTVRARYVTYVGHGATLNAGGTTSWNSVTEVSVMEVQPATPMPTPTNTPTPTQVPTCSTPPPTPTPPPPPVDVFLRPGDGQVTVQWRASTFPRYRVYRSTVSGGPYDVVADLTFNPADTTLAWTDTNVTNGTRYFYRVQVYESKSGGGGPCPPWTWTNSSPLSPEQSTVPEAMATDCHKLVPSPAWVVSASTSDGVNVPQNTVDGDLATRWSAQGCGPWLKIDLGSAQQICHVAIAFPNGFDRYYRFDLHTSNDDTSWAHALSALSGGDTEAPETFQMPDVNARWLRFTGCGNSLSTWNHVSELEVWAR
jgi:hypothetical protein